MDAATDPLGQDPTQVSLTPADVRLRRPIGEIFVELGFITADQLEAALVVQRRTGARIGEILVEQGSLTRLDLASALAEHWEPRRSEPETGGHSLVNGTSAPAPAGIGWSAEDHAAIAELELRLRVAEERLRAEPAERQRWGLRRRSAKDAEAALQSQVTGIAGRLAALDDVEAALAELRLSVERLDAVRVAEALATGTRLAGAEAAVTALDGLEERVRDGVDRELAGHFEALAARFERTEGRLDTVDALEARLAALTAVETELRAELEELRDRPPVDDPDERLLELSVRIDRTARDGHDRVVGLAEELRAEAAAKVAELGARLQGEPEETAALRSRVAELEEDVARAHADAERMATAWRAEVGSLAGRIDELLGLRHADARAARAATDQLGERLDELVGLRAGDAETDAAATQAMELREELERLTAAVAALGTRLDEQAAIGEEQARVTERAVSKGLASLGKRLVGPEAKYASEGKGLRRSIERLGAAVVEADARLAGQIPVVEGAGWVAFAPTDAGYRLVELSGSQPELGATVEVAESEGLLVVTRYGRSPLPFDGRPCAFLDRA